jgi:hypothetical protein
MDNGDSIEIRIEDPALYTHLALILDRPKVRKEVSLLRKKWANKKPNQNIGFYKDIATFLRTNKLSAGLTPVIEEVILKGYVTRHPRVTRLVIPRDMLQDIVQLEIETLDDEEYEYAILTPTEATEEEVIQELRYMKQTVKKSLERDYPPYEMKQPVSDTISNIKRDREWYFRHEKGESYLSIALDVMKDEDKAHQYKDSVRKAVKQYEKKLQKLHK